MRQVRNKRTRKNKYTAVKIAVVLVFLCAVAGMAVVITAAEANSDKIIRNVYVDDVRIGGLDTGSAIALLEEEFSLRAFTVVLPDGSKKDFTLDELGMHYKTDVLVGEAYDLGKNGSFGENIAVICRSFFTPSRLNSSEVLVYTEPSELLTEFTDGYKFAPTESQFAVEGDKVIITNGMNGAEIDVNKLISMIAESGISSAEYEAPVNILPFTLLNVDDIYNKTAADPHPPYGRNSDGRVTATVKSFNLDVAREIQKINTHEGAVYEFSIDSENVVPLEDENLFPDVLGEKTTEFDTGYTTRVNNLKLAASLINGAALLPGEEFSFNKNNGEITKEKGYQTAKGYANGKVVDTVGAGVCQVSSTLYNAALYSGMTIVKRSSHSLPVSYLPLGQDAAISYPRQDFIFKNSSESPVKIFAWVENGEITVQIRGMKSESFDEIKIENNTVSVIKPKTKEEEDPSLEAGKRVVSQKGSKGYVVESQRVYYKDGIEIKREPLTKSTYMAQDEIIKVGAEKE